MRSLEDVKLIIMNTKYHHDAEVLGIVNAIPLVQLLSSLLSLTPLSLWDHHHYYRESMADEAQTSLASGTSRTATRMPAIRMARVVDNEIDASPAARLARKRDLASKPAISPSSSPSKASVIDNAAMSEGSGVASTPVLSPRALESASTAPTSLFTSDDRGELRVVDGVRVYGVYVRTGKGSLRHMVLVFQYAQRVIYQAYRGHLIRTISFNDIASHRSSDASEIDSNSNNNSNSEGSTSSTAPATSSSTSNTATSSFRSSPTTLRPRARSPQIPTKRAEHMNTTTSSTSAAQQHKHPALLSTRSRSHTTIDKPRSSTTIQHHASPSNHPKITTPTSSLSSQSTTALESHDCGITESLPGLSIETLASGWCVYSRTHRCCSFLRA